MAAIVVLFRTMSHVSEAGADGVRVKGFWFINRMIRHDDIASAAVRKYPPLVEYGGWGYRIWPSGKAYNAQGDEGVQLMFKDGDRVAVRERPRAGDRRPAARR